MSARPLLLLRSPHEPFSPLARGAPDATRVIDSPARQRLIRELERYVRGEVAGRSFLVAGHRGAGKTTMVLSAIEEVHKACKQRAQRPLPVRLNAPDLMAVLDESGGEGASETERPVRLLMQLALALANAVADEFVRCFTGSADGRERLEIAAELRIELEEAPTLEQLRTVWERFGLVADGVLFPRDVTRPEGGAGARSRGLLEIAALWRTLQVHQVVSGELRKKRDDKQTDERVERQERTLKVDAGKLADRLFAVIVGAAVGGALYNEGPFLATAAGLCSAALASLAFDAYGKWEWTRRHERTRTYTPDMGLGSLSRLLPRLVDQMREVGLAPVFVVDELDKVGPGAGQAVGALVERLKSFVTEQSFFLFLADRSYHEFIEQQTRSARFPVEHTYFSDRLFLTYQPEDLHRYLDEVLVIPEGLTLLEKQRAGWDRDVLRHVLLRRSGLHLYDLRAELQGMVHENGVVVDTSSSPRDDEVYRLDVYFQLAIERVLSQESLRRRMRLDSHFSQRVVDVLYAVPQLWRAGTALPLEASALVEGALGKDAMSAPDLRLVVAAAEQLVAHLSDFEGFVPQLRGTATPKAAVDTIPSRPFLELENGERVWRFDSNGLPTDIDDALSTPAPEPSLHRESGFEARPEAATGAAATAPPVADEALVPGGAALGDVEPEPAPAPSPARRQAAPEAKKKKGAVSLDWAHRYADEIRDVDAGVRSVTDGRIDLERFALHLGGVPTTPSWEGVSSGLARAETGSLTFEDARAIREYARRLRAHIVVVSQALLWGAAMRGISRKSGGSDDWGDALERLARAMTFRQSDRLWLTEHLEPTALQYMLDAVGIEVLSLGRVVPRDARDWEPVARAAERIDEAIASVGELKVPASAWDDARKRVFELLDKRVAGSPPSPAELACIASASGPARYLDLGNLEAVDWRAVLARVEGEPRSEKRAWLHGAALIALDRADEVQSRTLLPDGDPFARLARAAPGNRKKK